MSTPTPAVRFDRVRFSYGPNEVIHESSFELKAGAPLCIVGPNGGGKTTVLRLILGLLKPLSGSIEVLGKSPQQARSEIGYMPQALHFDPKFPITVYEVVEMGLLDQRWFGPRPKDRKQRITEALEAVNMQDGMTKPFANLSGGQRQRVLIARALVSRPALLLMDEPTANLDMTLESRLLETVQQFRKDMTILMVSHDLAFVSEFVKTVLCVNRHVHTHPTESISPEMVNHLYGSHPRRVLHETDLPSSHCCDDHK